MALASELVYANLSSRQADFLGDTIADGLIALGGNQADALAITASINNFTTVTGAAFCARLPILTATKYTQIVVRNNDAADDMTVFPATGESINALAANTGITVTASTTKIFYKVATSRWIST